MVQFGSLESGGSAMPATKGEEKVIITSEGVPRGAIDNCSAVVCCNVFLVQVRNGAVPFVLYEAGLGKQENQRILACAACASFLSVFLLVSFFSRMHIFVIESNISSFFLFPPAR